MAGDWIKMRVWLSRDPKVISIADFLASDDDYMRWLVWPARSSPEVNVHSNAHCSVTRDVTVCVTVASLLVTWGVARDRGRRDGDDLALDCADVFTVDAICGVPSFGRAMCSVDWLIEQEDGSGRVSLRFPKFFTENVSTDELARARNAARQRSYRQKLLGDGSNKRDVTVTSHSNVTRDVTVTPRGEERRGDKKKTPQPPASGGGGAEQSEAESAQSKPPECLDTPEFRAAWERWLAHRRQRRCAAYKPIGQATQWKRLAELGPERAVAAIDFSIAQNYQGIYEERSAALPGAGGRLKQETLGDKIARLEAERRKAGEQ